MKKSHPLIGGPYTSVTPVEQVEIVAGQTWTRSRPRRTVTIDVVNPPYAKMDIIVIDDTGRHDAIWEPTFRARYALSDSEGGAS